jgi:hypothetical protein
MEQSYNSDLERERQQNYSYETTKVNGVIYDVRKLEALAEQLPIQEVPTEQLRDIASPGHHYWMDKNGHPLGPYDIIQDWAAAQNNPAWEEHVATIKRADLDRPLWVTKDEESDHDVFNGLHRLTRAFIDKVPAVKVRVFENLPESAKVRE